MSALVGSYLDRFGNTVILTRAQWEDHIVAEQLDMASLLWSLSRVLRHPRQVNQDTSLEARRCFYRDALVPRKLVKVVVEYPPDDSNVPLFSPVVGTVVTAYLVDRVPTRQQRIWP